MRSLAEEQSISANTMQSIRTTLRFAKPRRSLAGRSSTQRGRRSHTPPRWWTTGPEDAAVAFAMEATAPWARVAFVVKISVSPKLRPFYSTSTPTDGEPYCRQTLQNMASLPYRTTILFSALFYMFGEFHMKINSGNGGAAIT